MKKYFYMAALLIVAVFTMTSCGSDEPKEKDTATATYYLTFSQDMLDACSLILITYKAENGRNVMEAVTSTWWTKTVTSDKFPAEFGVMYKFSTKSESELTKDKYNLTCDLKFTGKTSKSGSSYNNTVTILNATDVAKNKVLSTLEKVSGKSTGFKVTKDGIYSAANNLNYD